MEELESVMYKFLNETNIKLKMGKTAGKNFRRANKCWFCVKKVELDGGEEVSDHCPLAAEYRGAAHDSCILIVKNVNLQLILFFSQFIQKRCSFNIQTLTSISLSYINCKPLPTIIEFFIPVNYGCSNFLKPFRLLDCNSDSLTSSINDVFFQKKNKEIFW